MVNKNTYSSKNKNNTYIFVALACVIFFTLLLMRDTYSVDVNKYVFLGITCIFAICMKANHLIYLFCFLFPVYVGLPGNYMTIVLIFRLLFEVKQFKSSSFMLSLVLGVYVLIQNLITGYTGIVPMMFVAGVFVIFLLFTLKDSLDPTAMIVMYSAGVAALGLIMLLSTLQVYTFEDLMSSSFRLGSSSVDYVEEGIMNVNVDPNFYGTFAISSISMAVPVVLHAKIKPITKIILSTFLVVQLIVALIGLSRSFIIVFAAWVLLYSVLQKNLKATSITLIVMAVIVFVLVTFMPNVIETILARFESSDMATGNGRTTLIQKFWNEWGENIFTMLFGVGMFYCDVHCTPLQFLFGGGITMFVLAICLSFSYMTHKHTRWNLLDCVPFIATFIMMCTVPAACLVNTMFPLVFIGLIMQSQNAHH